MRTAVAWAVVIPLALASWLIAWLDRLLGLSLAFPRDLAALERRRDWLVRALKQSGALSEHAQVHDVRISPLAQTVAFRSCSGFVTVTHGHDETLECFAKFAPTAGSVWNRAVFNIQMNAVKEVVFNDRYLRADASVPAPRPYCAKVAPFTGNLCLVTERMRDVIEHREDLTALPPEQLALALDGLATLHARYWGKPSPGVLPIGPQVVRWFDSLVSLRWSRAARTLLVQSWSRMNEAQTVLHGDARVGNMLFPTGPRGRFVLFDWQAVRTGRAAFDLAYFLMLSLPTPQRRSVEKDSLDTYYQALVERGVGGYTREEFGDDYRHGCLCVLVLLTLPLLSGEASADAATTWGFVYGMGLWHQRMTAFFAPGDFDFAWVASRYGLSEEQARAAVAEMLGTLERRLAQLAG